jgi:D-alanine--poly(phosphoribitol) ligase subunit 1
MNYNLALPFYNNATRNPERPALSVEKRDFSYGELLAVVERVATWLRERRAGEVRRVGILASRSLEAYAGILGTCWVGAAYVPLNPDWPAARLIKVLEATELDALVVDDRGLKVFSNGILTACPRHILAPSRQSFVSLCSSGSEVQVAGFDTLLRSDQHHLPKDLREDDLAYIMFTSGTTGSPKGVMISVGNVAQFLTAMRDRFPFDEKDRISQTFELTFDLSVFDMFMTWSSGAALQVVPGSQLIGPSRFIQERELTVWFSVPSTVAFMRKMKMLESGAFPSLRYSAFCGEPLPLSSAESWRKSAPNSIIDNLYGPTEATVACLAQRYSERPNVTKERGIIAIGKPFAGTQAAIVDSSNRFFLAGEKGELALSGKQVSRGYFKDAQKTAARFPTIEGRVWYLTGDLAYQDDSGTFHHLGRVDHQVKVLGNRVELEDIEANLREICGTDLVAAIAWPETDGSAQGIVAFISGTSLSAAEVRGGMKRRVPQYMVPSQVCLLERLPLSTSGKIDRKALISLLSESGGA